MPPEFQRGIVISHNTAPFVSLYKGKSQRIESLSKGTALVPGSGRSEMDTTNTIQIILAVVVFLVLAGLIGMALVRRRRTKRLQEHFGPEYESVVSKTGDRRQAESELEERIAHVNTLHIRPLTAEEVNRYSLEWQAIQTEFVDEPLAALQKANHLIQEVMEVKGYPVEDFEQQTADISVDYPELVGDYRGMHFIAVRGATEKVSTEEMRQAMVHGRALFENLIKQTAREEKTPRKEKI